MSVSNHETGFMAARRIGVVVPARNEAVLMSACLEALAVAAEEVDVPVAICVVADHCTDSTVGLAHGSGVEFGLDLRVLEIRARSVGIARRAGMADLLARLGRRGTWLATTDADSTVPVDWLSGQVRYARSGFGAVAGTVEVTDWSRRGHTVQALAELAYGGPDRLHVHGANLSFRADSYERAGGFAAVDGDEDVALVAALIELGETVMWAHDLPVVTSSRRVARAPLGFATYLNNLEYGSGQSA